MEEQFAVTAATGALGPVLKKLAALLGDEYKLQDGTRRDIEFIKSELEPVHDLLGKLWGREDLDVACKDWMMEAREMSYDLEDGIDSFTDGLERDDGGFIQRGDTVSPFKELMGWVKGVSQRRGEMEKISKAVICNRSKLTTNPRAHFLHKDPSDLVGMEAQKKLVIRLLQKNEMVCIVGFAGMGKTTLADLVYQTIGDEFQCRAFVSVHPSPNMTEILGTILSQVTDGAMSPGSGTIFTEKCGTEPEAEQNGFVKGISTFLSDKRYLVIIDDIWHWEEWEVIRKALPKNNLGSKLIMTTRLWTIAQKCSIKEQDACKYELEFGRADAERLLAMRLSKSAEGTNAKVLSAKIVGMFGRTSYDCCPLAVICLSSAWADRQHGGGDGGWDTWASHVLYDGFLITPCMKPLVQSLCLGFDDLPIQLRTCLLYCTIYPLDHTIDRGCLVRKWVAEGFASQEEVAQAYIDKLVSMNLFVLPDSFLLMPEWVTHVHPIMRAFLMCKAKEDNFLAYYGAGNSSHAKQQIRRLSLISTDRNLDADVVSHTRSLVVSGEECQLDGVPFKAFKKLRVLEIYQSSRLENGHLVDICGLIWLRYLALIDCTQITELPREIGRLQNLQTLDVSSTNISKLPTEIGKLKHLETLDVSSTEVVELPTCIEKLQSLKTLNVSWTKVTDLPTWIEKLQSLNTLNVSWTKVTELPREIKNLERLETLNISRTLVSELPKEIVKLQHLRTVDIRGTKVVSRELNCMEVPISLLSVVLDTHGYSYLVVKSPLVVISSSGGEEVISCSEAKHREYLSILVLFNHLPRDPPVAMLRVAGRHMKVPQWVKQDLCNVCSLDISLCKLVKKDLEFLKTQMPNLQALQLRLEVLPQKPVAITGGGFAKLETFYVDCRLPRVITFKEGGMPKLEHLEFKFYTGTARQDYSMGIMHLPSLEKVVFRCSENYKSDSQGIGATIEAMRKEATEHPNWVTLYVNDKQPEVFHSGAKWISQAERAIIQKETKERERIKKQRKQLYDAAKRRAEQNKNNTTGTSDF